MKIAITCDCISPDLPELSMINMVANLLPSAEIYTLIKELQYCHEPISQKVIHASYLNRFTCDKVVLRRLGFLVPSTRLIPESIDWIINISSGFSHAFKRGKNTRQITYLYRDITFKSGLFSSFNQNWHDKGLEELDALYVSSPVLGKNSKAQVLWPFFNALDFRLSSRQIQADDSYLAYAESLTYREAKLLLSRGEKVFFFGSDNHLTGLKKKYPLSFYGTICNGTLSSLLEKSKALIDFSSQVFPYYALVALACGRAVIMKKGDIFDNQGVVHLTDIGEFSDDLIDFSQLVPEQLRRISLGFSALRFRSNLIKIFNHWGIPC